MTLGLMDDRALERFNRIRRVVSLRTKGGGITLTQLGDASALAREMEKDTPDPERVDFLGTRLGIEEDEIHRVIRLTE